MSDRIDKYPLKGEIGNSRAAERSGGDSRPHRPQGNKDSQISNQQDKDTLSKAPAYDPRWSVSNRPGSAVPREMLQTPAQTAANKRSHSPGSNIASSSARVRKELRTEIEADQTNTAATNAPENTVKYKHKEEELRKIKFLKENPGRRVEQWGHYELGKILDTGPCPYTSGRPILWGQERDFKVHVRKHLEKRKEPIGVKTGDGYHHYAVSILLLPISPDFPAFISNEMTTKKNESNRTKSPPFIRKVYRLDRDKKNVVIGDAYGHILTCFHPDCDSIDEWFKEKAKDCKNLVTN